MSDSYPHIYLSPHYDDASLSCGGAIHRQTQAGQTVLVVTICAAPPEPNHPLSPFAEAMHRSWGHQAEVVAIREAEDRVSMNILGADYLRLNFNDCIYRGHPERGEWFYNNNHELFGPIHRDDLSLNHRLVEALLELLPNEVETVIYAPLGVGHHVDHQLAHAAARQLHRQGWRIVFYEDYPYADPDSGFAAAGWDQYSLAATLAAKAADKLRPEWHFFAEENMQAKLASVRAYASQVPSLFGGETEMEVRLRSYALQVGAGRLAERVWFPG